MGRQALIAALCWVILQGTLAVNLVLNNNLSAESVKRLYRNAPYGMYRYGTASPYGSYSYQVPYVMSPKVSSPSRQIQVRDNSNSYLKDSYGNKYVPSSHMVPLKPLTPQQFLQLQALPAHFVQPLSAAPINFKQATGTQQIVYGSHYKLPLQQNSGNHYVYEQSHPGVSSQSYTNSYVTPSVSQNHLSESLLQYPRYSTLTFEQPTPTYGSLPELEQSVAAAVQQHSTSNKAHVYSVSSTLSPIQYTYSTTPKPQYQPESEEIYDEDKREAVRNVKTKLRNNPSNVVPVKTVVNGKKAIVKIETNPTLPLLDLSLLEPLTFDNPLVPQVQHFLPRIHDANYHKLSDVKPKGNKKYQKGYVIQKTKQYDTGYHKEKQKKGVPKRKHVPSVEIITFDEIAQASTARPTIATEESPQKLPEISYEINSPTYKETYQEKAVSYNKETNSEPVHYTYGTHKHEEPTHYSYSHSAKEPIHVKSIHYEGHGEGPNVNKPGQQNLKENPKHDESSDEVESSSEEDDSRSHEQQEREENKKQHHLKSNHREEEYHHNFNSRPSTDEHQDAYAGSYQYFPDNGFHPVAQYEEEIQLNIPEKRNNEQKQQSEITQTQQLKPQQHQVKYQIKTQHNEQQYEPTPQRNDQQHNRQAQHHPNPPQQVPQRQTQPVHIQEKTKKIYIKEETPVEDDYPKNIVTEEERKEQDFENAYKNAAFGFPAYDSHAEDVEKDIYNPENYGIPRKTSDYNPELSPFLGYFEKGDDFPKKTRLNYLDMRDKTKDNYFLDFSINHPQFMADRYTKKVDYLKLLQKQKSENSFAKNEKNDNQGKQSEKYAAIPYDFSPKKDQKSKLTYTPPFATIPVQEYDYSKGVKRDNFAFASKPLYTYKINTHFVEPQFQYGFEPVALPRLLDSELAAMASNNSPESEKPTMRKTIYKENFYVKKTSLSDGSNS